MKRTYYTLRLACTVFALLFVTLCANAHMLNDLFIRVVLNDAGHARVVEIRDCSIGSNGTEGYIKQYNLHGIQVGELAVSDETGAVYENTTPWNVDLSRTLKTARCGIYKSRDGLELCWGLGNGGHRVYNIHYTLSGLVNSFDDYDGFNFKFYEPSAGAYAKHARLVIEAEHTPLSPENARVWAFRYHGTVNFVDGKIVADTEVPFGNDREGLVIVAQFDKGVFHPVSERGGSFVNKVKKPAFKGSNYTLIDEGKGGVKASLKGSGAESESGFWSEIWNELSGYIQAILWIVLGIMTVVEVILVRTSVTRARHNNRLFGNKRGEMTEWSRTIPFGGDLYRTGEVLRAVNSDDVTPYQQIAAVVLRLTHEGRITLRTAIDAGGDVTGEYVVTPPLPGNAAGEQEELLNVVHEMMWNAAGDDHVLQPREMQRYMEKYPVEHRAIVSKVTDLLDGNGRQLSDLQPVEVKQVYGLKKFLQEFTLLDERGLYEVMLWKEYMVFATLYGIAHQVFKDLKRVWPDYVTLAPDDAMLYETDIASSVASYTIRGVDYVETYETPAERRARAAERHSGSGGSSSYGGGGGFSGGGGSGFR